MIANLQLARRGLGSRLPCNLPLLRIDSGGPVKQRDIEPGQCRWIVGNEQGGADALMCGASVASGSWCERHCSRCFIKPREDA